MIFYMHHPTDRVIHTTAFVTPVVRDWLKREIAQWVHHEGLFVDIVIVFFGVGFCFVVFLVVLLLFVFCFGLCFL